MSKLITLNQGTKFLLKLQDGKVTCAQAGRALEEKRMDEIIELIKHGVVKTPKGKVVHVPDNMGATELERLFEAIISGAIDIGELIDPLAPYRKIDGLLVVGAKEWEKAMTGINGENPLELKSGWVPDVPLPKEWTPELLRKLVALCKTSKWGCMPVLQLELSDVNGKPTSLTSFYEWWGVAHDGLKGGIIRKDLDHSNWFIKDWVAGWPHNSATGTHRWRISYVDFPAFTTKKSWGNQQTAVREHGLTHSTVTSDVLMMLLLAINYQKFRTSTWARTGTIHDGDPLYVYFYDDGLSVRQDRDLRNASESVGAALEGVPLELVS